MDFFAAQDLSRSKTKWLFLLYVLAIIAIIAGIYLVLVLVFAMGAPESMGLVLNLELLVGVTLFTLLVIGGGSLYKTLELRSGGEQVATSVGGVRVHPGTTDLQERRLLNVVEEMALASGVSVPPVYIIDGEPGINAFAAGYSPSDAVIGVNRGTIETLNRDELQGVIAHEFSHILNGDMRMNIRLIGVLFGIQVLTLIGYFIFRSVGSGGHGRRRDSNKDSGQAIILILAVAGALVAFGLIGQLFARLIKASISRQREYLADASAVQFTRDPNGIGGALKMIGASSAGSAVKSWEAEQLSHMYFASCFSSGLSSLLATHPPLVPRIQKIDHRFDGDFKGYLSVRQRIAQAKAKRLEKEQEQKRKLDSMNPLGGIFPASIAGKFSFDPALLIATIGAPDQRDVDRSRAMIQTIPSEIIMAARDPFGARCVAFALLCSGDKSMRSEQMNLIGRDEGAASLEVTQRLLLKVDTLQLVFRLPVMEMIQASLSELSPQQYKRFRATVIQLVRLDNKTSLFEFVVRHHLLMHLDRRFAVTRPVRIRYESTAKLGKQIEMMLSAFATASISGSVLEHAEEPDPEQVLASYRLAMQVAGFGEAAESEAELRAWEVEQLEDCMRHLHRASHAVRKQFLHAAAVLITYDHEITIAESEFFRAVAESLDCPVPVLAVGRIQKAGL